MGDPRQQMLQFIVRHDGTATLATHAGAIEFDISDRQAIGLAHKLLGYALDNGFHLARPDEKRLERIAKATLAGLTVLRQVTHGETPVEIPLEADHLLDQALVGLMLLSEAIEPDPPTHDRPH